MKRITRKRKPVIIAAVLLALSACGPDRSPSGEDSKKVWDRLSAGEVALWATAPDGTQLWATIGMDGRTVYFSSAGTQTSHTESCGKSCSKTVIDAVPGVLSK